MNILFLTVSRIFDINQKGIYTDLMRKFRDEGHSVYIVFPLERRYHLKTTIYKSDGINLLGVRTLNIQKTNFVEKGISTVLIEHQFDFAIKKYYSKVKFNLLLYSTPPITFTKVIKEIRKNNPKILTYLLLKDIFPQNAVDLGILSERNILYKYFRFKETKLYSNSDYIGCMSKANVKYVIKHNSFYPSERVEIAPNSISINERFLQVDRQLIREKYFLPVDLPIFIYGGNLGKPQGIDFVIECMDRNINRIDCHFLIVGDGTEYDKLKRWYNSTSPSNVTLLQRLSSNEYDLLVKSCDVGLIFLDYNFTIPNYPSRLLAYLENKMPIISSTDKVTDIGMNAVKYKYGLSCYSNDSVSFSECVNKYVESPELVKTYGENGYNYLKSFFLVENTYSQIISHLK